MIISSLRFCSVVSMQQLWAQCLASQPCLQKIKSFFFTSPNSQIKMSDLPVTTLFKSTLQPLCIPRQCTYIDAECLCAPVCETNTWPIFPALRLFGFISTLQVFYRGEDGQGQNPNKRKQEKNDKKGREGSVKSMTLAIKKAFMSEKDKKRRNENCGWSDGKRGRDRGRQI